MKSRKFLITVLIIIIACSSLKGLARKIKNYYQVKDTSASDAMTEHLLSFSISGFSDTGRKIWEMKARQADIRSGIANLTTVDADSYGERVKVKLTSDSGIFDRAKNNLFLKDNVVITTDEGTVLKTRTLNWNSKEEIVSTEDYVHITRPDADIEGTGGSAWPDLKKACLNKEVKVITKEPEAVITCDNRLDLDYGNNIAYFYDNVKIDDGKTKIKCDKATAYFNPKDRTFKKVFCEGNVDIKRGEDITTAQMLTYLPDEGRVILTGSPKIIINSSEELMKKQEKNKDEQVKS